MKPKLVFLAAAVLPACWIGPGDWDAWELENGVIDTDLPEGDADSDADGDTDTDTDADADADADADSDTDADGDSDVDADTDADTDTLDVDDDHDGFTENEGDCDDADATTWPGATEVCEDGAANDCDATADEAFDTCWSVTDLGAAAAKLHGDGYPDQTGVSVAGAGDVDGDGYDDVLVGANGHDSYAGAAYLVSGPITGDIDLSSATRWTGDPSSTVPNAGISVAGAGDVDRDGYDDVLIGSHGDDEGGTDAGAAFLMFGPLAGDQDLSSYGAKLAGDVASAYAGSWVSGCGDTNGDGVPDLLIGARYDGDGGAQAGAAYLVRGPVSGLVSLSKATAKLTGESNGDNAGISVAGAGDVDGDGLNDLLIGAYGDDDAGEAAGAAYLLLSPVSASINLSAADAKLTGEAAGDNAGWAVAGAGDVDADGYDDLLIGADYYGTSPRPGAAYLVLGPVSADASLSTARARLVGEDDMAAAGMSVAGPGDVDQDGFDDLLIGAFADDDAGNQAGAAYLVLDAGSGSSSLADAEVKLLGESASDFAGAAVSGAGDTDGDGFPDLIIGATWAGNANGIDSGAAYLVLGTGY